MKSINKNVPLLLLRFIDRSKKKKKVWVFLFVFLTCGGECIAYKVLLNGWGWSVNPLLSFAQHHCFRKQIKHYSNLLHLVKCGWFELQISVLITQNEHNNNHPASHPNLNRNPIRIFRYLIVYIFPVVDAIITVVCFCLLYSSASSRTQFDWRAKEWEPAFRCVRSWKTRSWKNLSFINILIWILEK